MATKLTNAITINAAGKDIEFNGVDFTQDAFITLNNAASVTIKNCRIYNINVPTGVTRKHWLHVNGDLPMKIVVDRNFFGDSNKSGGNIHNLLELNCQLMDGSSISNNYFTENSCGHNYAGLYGAAEGATITISGNYFVRSAGGIRLGMKGAPTCTIISNNNVVDQVDTRYEPEDQGYLMFQPYGTKTTSFENCTVRMTNDKAPTSQIFYGFVRVGSDTNLTPEQYPVWYLDGVLQDPNSIYVNYYS